MELDESPVLRIASVASTDDGNRRGANNVSRDTLALRGPGLRNITVKFAQGLDQLLRLLQQALKPLLRLSLYDVLALDDHRQDFELVLVVAADLESLTPNLVHNRPNYIPVSIGAEEDDLVTRLAVIFAGINITMTYAWRKNDMADRKEEDPITFAAFTEIEAPGAFEVRSSFGSDPQTECGSKWAACIGSWV